MAKRRMHGRGGTKKSRPVYVARPNVWLRCMSWQLGYLSIDNKPNGQSSSLTDTR